MQAECFPFSRNKNSRCFVMVMKRMLSKRLLESKKVVITCAPGLAFAPCCRVSSKSYGWLYSHYRNHSWWFLTPPSTTYFLLLGYILIQINLSGQGDGYVTPQLYCIKMECCILSLAYSTILLYEACVVIKNAVKIINIDVQILFFFIHYYYIFIYRGFFKFLF